MTKKSIDPFWWLLLLVGPLFVASTLAALFFARHWRRSSARVRSVLRTPRRARVLCESHRLQYHRRT